MYNGIHFIEEKICEDFESFGRSFLLAFYIYFGCNIFLQKKVS